MQILFTEKTLSTPGPRIIMDCPSCHATGIEGITAAVEVKLSLFWILPFATSRWMAIHCTSCAKEFKSPRTCDELGQMSPAEISAMLAEVQATYVPFLTKFCVILAIVCGLIPMIGLIFALIGVAFTYKRRSGWRTAAFLGLALSVISSTLVTLLLHAPKHH